MVTRLRAWLQEWRFRRAAARVRRELALWGCDVSHLTDEEIAERFTYASRRLASCGMTVEEAAEAFAGVGRMARATETQP